MTTTFTELMQRATINADGLTAHVPEDWLQGRSAFGGVQLALCLRAMRALVPAVPLRTLQATLIAPVLDHVVVRTRLLRTGKNVTHVEARIVDGDATLMLCVGVFGVARTSQVRVTPAQHEVVNLSPIPMPHIPGVTPVFLQHYDARLMRGSFPYIGTPANECVFAIDLRDAGPMTEEHLVAVADFPPPLGATHLRERVPSSTLSWMVEFLTDAIATVPMTGLRVDTHLHAARDGYTNQTVQLWSADGTAILTSRQTMLTFS